MKFFVEDCFGTLQARVVILGIQIDDDCIVGLRTSLLLLILPSIYPIFHSFNTLNDEILSKIFVEPCKLE